MVLLGTIGLRTSAQSLRPTIDNKETSTHDMLMDRVGFNHLYHLNFKVSEKIIEENLLRLRHERMISLQTNRV